MQVSRQALHAGGAGIDDPFAANADSPYRSLGGFQNRMNEGTQGRGGGRRGFKKALEQVSPYSDDSRFDCGSTNINANCQRVTRISASEFFAHDGLCIIPTLCNSTGQYGDWPKTRRAGRVTSLRLLPCGKGAKN